MMKSETMMDRAGIDTYEAQIQVEATRLRAKLPPSFASWVIKNQAKRALEQTDEMLTDTKLERLKISLDDFDGLPARPEIASRSGSYMWVAAAQETLKTLQLLSEAIG
jgi:hypothetical protein